jgi:5-hydroxyisourate hydrolase-like protein (transthyretin family)
LREAVKNPTGVRLFGKVSESIKDPFADGWRQSKPLKGIRLRVEQLTGKKRVYSVVTNGEGKYEVPTIPAGTYRVTPMLPLNTKTSEYSLEPFDVKDRGCVVRDFTVENDSRVAGRLVDADGKPVKGVQVELLPAFGRSSDSWTGGDRDWTEEDGRFEFEEVPTGSYVLAVNRIDAPDDDAPFPTAFYPNTQQRAAAAILEVGRGQKISELVFRLPARLDSRAVHGIVTWADGRPAVNVEVYLEDVERLGWCVNGCSSKTDQHGTFLLKAYAGRRYRIRASGRLNGRLNGQELFAPIVTFSSEDPDQDFKLILNLDQDPGKVSD